MYRRDEKEMPLAIDEWGWKYHHLGVPTKEKRRDERYLPALKFAVSGFNESPFGIEWMRFDDDCPLHELIKTVPHLAFVVDNLEFELRTRGFNLLVEPNSPMDGIYVAMIEYNGVPIELMQFNKE